MTVYGGDEGSHCGRQRKVRASRNCAWELHLTCCHLWHDNISIGPIKIVEFSVSNCKYLDKGDAEENSIEIVLRLINKDIQRVLLRHCHQSLQWVFDEAGLKLKALTSWAITLVSSECDFVSICKLSSLSPFLCRQHRSTFIQEKLHKRDFTFSRRWTFCVRHWCRLFQGVQPNCQNPSAMFSTYIMRETRNTWKETL